jgi:hypothetical protein
MVTEVHSLEVTIFKSFLATIHPDLGHLSFLYGLHYVHVLRTATAYDWGYFPRR